KLVIFFQAEDCIRDRNVTGVQTCALPILSLLRTMLQNPNVVAVKNSSMPTQDIQMFKDAGIAARGEGGFVVFNGPDEQFVSGLEIGRASCRESGVVSWQCMEWLCIREDGS